MDSSYDRHRADDGKRPIRRSSRTGGSKKSVSRPRTNLNPAASAGGGDRAPNNEFRDGSGLDGDPRGSSGGREALQDNHHLQSSAQSKDIRVGQRDEVNKSRRGEKASRRGSRHTENTERYTGKGVGAGEGVRGELETSQEQKWGESAARHPVAGGGVSGGGADRAILEKWRTEATAAMGDRLALDAGGNAEPQKIPKEVEEDENAGDGYDDEGFEEYSDDSDPQRVPTAGGISVMTSSSTMKRGRTGSGAGVAGERPKTPASPILSPAIKRRNAADTVAPDEKALQELRQSLGKENDVAMDRSKLGWSSSSREDVASAAKDNARVATRGAKDAKRVHDSAKGSKSVAPGVRQEDGVSQGTFSVEASPVAAGKGNTRPRSSSFKMADAKALSRALAKGDPRAERVRAILSSSRFEVESARLFDQAPISPLDLYHRRLRGQLAKIRQTATQTNEDNRSVEAQTEEIAKADKEMQFHLGHDDTALENLMRRLCSARCPSRSQSSTGAEKSSSSNRTQENDYDDCGNGGDMTRTTFKGVSVPHGGGPLASAPAHAGRQGSGALSDARAAPLRLGRFLRQACVVMETLCEENLVSASTGESGAPKEECGDDDDGEREPFSMFPRNNGIGWEEVGREVMMNGNGFAYSLSAGYIESTTNNPSRHSPCLLGSLTSGCDVVGVAFSRAKRSMLVTAHARGGDANRREGYSEGGQDKMKGGRQRQRPALEGCGVVCVWNAEDANGSPVSVLFGEGLFRSLCLALRQPHIVLVGTAEGCLLLWDLREPAASSHTAEARALGLPCGLRSPTYITAGGSGGGWGGGSGLSDPVYGHASPIVSVVAIPTAEDGGNDGGGLGEIMSVGESNSCQVASMDDRGMVYIWLVSELANGDEGGSQIDLGLRPGGRVRLAIANTIRLGTALAALTPIVRTPTLPSFSTSKPSGVDVDALDSAFANALAFSTSDPNRFLVGTSSGRVCHASRLGEAPPPRAYGGPRQASLHIFSQPVLGPMADENDHSGARGKPGVRARMEAAWAGTGGVTCLSFSPFFQKYFLAGCGDGSVRLYKDDCAVPMFVWEDFRSSLSPAAKSSRLAISSVAWSEHRPAVFFVLDSAGTLSSFDLLKDDTIPIYSEPSPAFSTSSRDSASARETEAIAKGHQGHNKGEEAGDASLPSRGDAQAGLGDEQHQRCWSSPILALSGDTATTATQPRVAVCAGGKTYTRKLPAWMSRAAEESSVAGAVGRATAGGRNSRRGDGGGGNRHGERGETKMMQEWLRTVLWAG